MTCRDEILDCVRELVSQSGLATFTIEGVIGLMQERGTRYRESTIRTHVSSRMCINAPAHHASRYPDFERIGHGLYRLRP
jgi:hypothetical protein